MSKRTQANRSVFIFTAFLGIFGPVILSSLATAAHAGSVSDAQEQLNKAYDDYYDAISTGGKKTPEEQKAIRSRIVDPAMNKLNQSMKEETDDVVREHAKDIPNAKLRNSILESGSGSPSAATPGAPSSGNHAPEVILESTDIPKELEFPGKPKQPQNVPSTNSGAALSAPKSDPYLGPYAPKSR